MWGHRLWPTGYDAIHNCQKDMTSNNITKTRPCKIFHGCKNVHFQIKKIVIITFAQNIDCGYTLEQPHLNEAVLTSAHNLCSRAIIRK